jgi:hypothetical protein
MGKIVIKRGKPPKLANKKPAKKRGPEPLVIHMGANSMTRTISAPAPKRIEPI